MKFYRIITVSLVVLLFNACSEDKIKNPMVGLWEVEQVTIDGKKHTPDGKWMRFNADSTHESGNGWYQHSIGKYKVTGADNELFLFHSNGWKDEFENFRITYTDTGMIWKRTEDGNAVEVSLKQIDKLPTRQADEVMGIWQLNQTTIGEITMKAVEKNTIFLRWDKMFIAQDETNRSFGLYKTQGHRNEIEFVYYNQDCTREYWDYEIKNNILTLTSVNAEQPTKQVYTRIYDLN
jgi:hypothetical protein